ncbi:Nuclear cap-binding protein complex subunit [Trichinella spiralis]|uniref:Nuclear cap-binding protein complex subunit n=1 Tax=Trichinella spiralis TaxID=6334 RepID=A0ABR3KPP5_TRISP
MIEYNGNSRVAGFSAYRDSRFFTQSQRSAPLADQQQYYEVDSLRSLLTVPVQRPASSLQDATYCPFLATLSFLLTSLRAFKQTFFGNRQRLLKLNEQKTGAIECHVSFPLTPMCTMGISVADRGTEQPLGGSFNVPSVSYSGIHFYCHCSPVCSSTKKAIVASVWWPACFWTNGQLNPPCGADTSRHNSVYCDKNVSVSMRQNRPRSSLV